MKPRLGRNLFKAKRPNGRIDPSIHRIHTSFWAELGKRFLTLTEVGMQERMTNFALAAFYAKGGDPK